MEGLARLQSLHAHSLHSLMPPSSASGTVRYTKRHPLEALGRVGYAVKGVVYALVGVLAFDAARGSGDPSGQQGAFEAIAQTSYGSVLLWIVVIGLAAYGLWRIALAVLDPEHEGNDVKGGLKRTFYVVSGVIYGGLAYSAYQTLQGSGGGGNGTEERTQTALGLPGGRWLVGLVALGVLGYGVVQFRRAYTASFMTKLDLEGHAARNRTWVRRTGQWGLAARGVVYLIIGGFLGQAALRSNANEAGGLDQALAALQSQPLGPWLLGAVAVGLILYGAYCWVNAAYRRYEGDQ